jgi:3-hydroxyisobutyrate dehydrogenase-like beta-hydroxyacid dehydrogenase
MSADELRNTRVGLAGLGLMGMPMARRLLAAGIPLRVWNRTPEKAAGLAVDGAVATSSPAELAAGCDIVILMLADTAAVRDVLLGDHGVVAGLGGDSLVVDMGTTAVPDTREFGDAVRARGAEYVDAPVSGGVIGAENGTLTIMAGGTEAAIDRAMPVFRVLGSSVTRVGDVGAGQVAKAANQVIVGLTIGAVAEALTLARRAGVDPARVREALSGGFASSRILEVHGQRMIEGKFAPGGRCTTQRKDLQQALDLARSLSLELPATRLCRDLYDRLIAAGDGDLDHSALVRVLEVRD